MTRMMDPSIMQLSQLLSEMGDMAIKSVQMAVSSYLRGENTAKKVKKSVRRHHQNIQPGGRPHV